MKTYSSKSNAKRAALKTLNADAFTVEKNNDGQWFIQENAIIGDFIHCPHCEVHLSNGCMDNEQWFQEQLDIMADPSKHHGDAKKIAKAMAEETTHEFNCLGCGADFGEPLKLTLTKRTKPIYSGLNTGVKIEKNRDEQNGIKRPSIGGKCRAIWDFCDSFKAKDGMVPMPKDMKEAAEQYGWNANNAVIEMYQWRKFCGIISRK